MELSCRGRYAMRAMVELAEAEPGTPIPLSHIAERQEISRKYLQQLMAGLRRAGLVHVVKGFRGGFLLARPPEQIRAGEILRALEGDLALVECVRHEHICGRVGGCRTRELWAGATRVLEEYFDGITLADLIGDEPCEPDGERA